jgi:preprotein translocase subunit SecF
MKNVRNMPGKQKEESSGKYDFLGISKYIATASVLLTLLSLGIIFSKGFQYGVDFAGGTEIQVQFARPVEASAVRKFVADEGFPKASVQSYGSANEYLIRLETAIGKTEKETNDIMKQTIEKLTKGLVATFGNDGPNIRRVDTVGPQVGAELKRNGILAGFYSLLLILIYVGIRFEYKYAPGAVFCLFHDAIITLGIYSLFDWEVTTQTMAAVLTIIGYSLNDTIVIFDRMRENSHLHRGKDFAWLANKSINDTLSRTILTYIFTFVTVFAMYFLAGGVIQDFARAMIIGMCLGVYSTVYVATPLVLLLDKLQNKDKAVRVKAQTAKA